MAVVYRGWDTQLQRTVALKVLEVQPGFHRNTPDDDALHEAKTLARLEHPGIVPIYDAGRLPDGRVYCAMRLVVGERLNAFLAREKNLYERLRVFQKICEVIAFAHHSGVIHRDLKPQNVMVGKFGEVFVIDWGLAEWLTSTPLRAAGLGAGTTRYMAPEQGGEQPEPVDGRADVFSLGAILEDLIGPDAPKPLAAIANKSLAADPIDRYQHVEHLADDLSRFMDRLPVSAYDESLFERLGRFAARHRVLLLLLATYALVQFALFLLSRS